VDAREAERIGLVSRVLPDPEVVPHALDVAAQMSELSAFGLQMTKRVCWANLETPSLLAAVDLEDRNQLLLGNTENLIECIRARKENRKPVYTDMPRRDVVEHAAERPPKY
jgi:enoyl-CoA hydratase